MITKHERVLLEELQSTRGSKSKRFVIDGIALITSFSGLIFLFFLHHQSYLILLASALCGGMIGVSIEKMYSRQIMSVALKLYKMNSGNPT
ncbi:MULTISPECIES: hypothetical protein [Nostocales]|uniref:Uncharacterized protein n=3 Tax=Nostocales TaxID=1161 RepID=A0A0C1NAT7_9CYAN|nr:hypothetical protein [Tolypothrix bouteillei]KAF3884700.1 hypothetical protein DA73_0400003840 [Tolypothrix bouteillei VB521301]